MVGGAEARPSVASRCNRASVMADGPAGPGRSRLPPVAVAVKRSAVEPFGSRHQRQTVVKLNVVQKLIQLRLRLLEVS